MGLYQKICERFSSSQNSIHESVGLLAKAQKFLDNSPTPPFSVLIDEPFIFFKNFASEVGLQKVAVLIPVKNNYQTIFSYGIEPSSRKENISTIDFWDGTITSEQWYSLSGEDLTSFYQLFSESDVYNLKHLHIKRFNINETYSAIILILEDTENSYIDLETTELVFPDLNKYLESFMDLTEKDVLFPKNKSTKELYDAVESKLSFGSGFMYSISLKEIFKSLDEKISFEDFSHIFSICFSAINSSISNKELVYFTNELEIRYVNFAQTETDLFSLNYRFVSLIKNCFSYVENPSLVISKFGYSTDLDEIIDFIYTEN